MGFCCDVVCSLESFFFFFKQKTAYEMRISDWSSDVCSSDLLLHIAAKRHVGCDTNTAKIGKYLLRGDFRRLAHRHDGDLDAFSFRRSEEHTSAPVTNAHLVCRLLLAKKKNTHHVHVSRINCIKHKV